MSRSTHQRQQQKLQLQQQQQQLLAQQQQMAENDAAAAAAEMFDLFCVATTMRQCLGLHRNMCDLIGMRPAPLNEFYPKLKTKIRSWKAQALWKKFDARAAHRAYSKGNACTGTRVLVIGAGPCGLRTAIEAQLLGAKVVVVEKRDRISRNNVLHLWPFVITDLRNLGAKKFYGKFCAGSIDHISIRQLQCILLKVALLLGVEIHEGVSFDGTIEPTDGCGWRAAVTPTDHAVSHYEFDVLIGADGKRNTLEGFKRKEFRGKLAIAITANFINKKTEAEAKAEEISGVAFIFNQSFFKELYHTTGIDLENIVYYKDETHYFVMTAKKHSLIDKGVIMHDFADPAELLAPPNVNTEKLLDYAREAAEFSTKYQMPNLEFAVNHYGKPDVAMFDFTSMFAAETSCRVIMRKGYRLLQCLVGDSLLEPFWPTGSGCARGFLSSMDAAYATKLWSNAQNSTLGVLAQRESIYRLLNQTTPENLQRDIGSYTVDPATRYPNLNRTSVNVWQVKHLIDTDDPAILEQTFMDTNALQAPQVDTPVRRKRRSGDSLPLSAVLLRWICAQLHSYEFTKSLKEVSDVFTNGKVLCALINRYRPDLVDFNAVKDLPAIECNEIAFKTLEKELNIPRIMSGKDSIQLNTMESKLWLNYLEQICEVFRGEIPHVKHPKMDFTELREKYRFNSHVQPDFSKLLQLSTKQKAKSPMQDMVDVPQPVRRSVLDEERSKRQRKHAVALDAATVEATGGQQGQAETPRRAKKRRSAEKTANIEERQKRLQEIEENRQDRQSKRRQQRYQQTQNFYKSLHMLQANTLLRESDDTLPFEDYSIFLYRQQAPVFNDRVKDLERKLLYPDRERCDIPSALPRNATDEQFSDRIKSMEQRITSRNTYGTDKKPKDLMRAIGKIDSTDWNVREIEKKIEQSKKTEIHGPKGREKVPKWSKEQFTARQHKMSKPIRQDSGEEKFKEIDQTLKNIDKQLKEGSLREVGERGRNKVASIAGQFVKKDDTSDEKNPPTTVVQKPSTKVALAFKKQAASEKCHFCKQTVYLMEKINTEGLILHRSCLKCHHCHTNLRPGGYAFDRDDPNGRFYCTQHFRLPAKAIRPIVRKPGQRKPTQQQQAAAAAVTVNVDDGTSLETADKLRGRADSLAQLDLLDRGQTPERIEFENTDAMSDGEPSEEHIIDENEWSGRNFLPESNNDSESDLSSSDDSDSESDSDMFEEANDSPLGVQTLQLATDWIGKQNYSDSDDSDDFYDSSDGIADDGKDDTEGEEFKKARELRREEVRLLPLPANLPTDTETEPKNNNENKENVINTEEKENIESATATNTEEKNNVQPDMTAATLPLNTKTIDLEKFPAEPFKSDEQILTSVVTSVPSSPAAIYKTTKADMEKIEQNSERKFSAEIEEISEKLYRLNNMMKMSKDLESLAKENIVNSDILKKLTLKEKWLANNNAANINPVAPKSQFDLKIEKIFKSGTETTEGNKPKPESNIVESSGAETTEGNKPKTESNIVERSGAETTEGNKPKTESNIVERSGIETTERNKPKTESNIVERSGIETTERNKPKTESNIIEKIKNVEEANKPLENVVNLNFKENNPTTNNVPPTTTTTAQKQSPIAEKKNINLNRNNSLKKTQKHLSPSASPRVEKKSSAASSRSNSFKSATSSPKMPQKSGSLKKPEPLNESKMQLENILDIVKKIDISGTGNQEKSIEMAHITESSDSDIGKLLYDAESKFSPKSNRTAMSNKLKEIESKSFAGTMDTIKSQLVMPTVSAQAAPNVDLTKYFPNQKPEKANMAAINKTQKNLKDVDLTKYFPSSPVQQRRSTVVTVAEKLKKSQTETAIAPSAASTGSTSKLQRVPTVAATVSKTKVAPKRQASLGDSASSTSFSLREHQLDGAVDLAKKKSSIASTTINATGVATKKGNVKIIKKIVPKGTKAKKATEAAQAAMVKMSNQSSSSIIPRDEADRILDEILHSDNEHKNRSPSFEYKKLFDEEKSPSEDVSDKIERILEETGIDLGIARKQPNSDKKKKLLKAKSLGEGEFERNQNGNLTNATTGSLQSVNDDESTTSGEPRVSGVQNILKRFESMSSVKSNDSFGGAFKLQRMESSTSNLNKSRESIVSRESDSLSDLEKTMEYLKSEWRSEATNFLQKKRDTFYAQKRSTEIEAEQQKKAKVVNELPVQYRESKLAKFFGIKQKSPEKKSTFLDKKKAAPEKKKSPMRNKASPEKKTPPSSRKTTFEKKNSPEKKHLTQTKKATVQSKIAPMSSIETLKPICGTKPLKNIVGIEEPEIIALLDSSQNTLEKPSEMVDLPTTGDGLSKFESNETNNKTHLLLSKSLNLNEINNVDKTLVSTDSIEKNLLNHSTDKNTTELVPAATELARKPSLDKIRPSTPTENSRPLVEDIKNLPKFGCDKSQSNSRRNSQSSLQGRRLSDGLLTDNLELVGVEKLEHKVSTASVEENHSADAADLTEMTKRQLEDLTKKETIGTANDHESSRSCSKSSSAQPVTVKLRGSSEEESIEKLFCQFSDDMLVDVEFDSNDDLIAITPRAVLINNEEQNDADRDYLDRLESLEKDPELITNNIASFTTINPATADKPNLDESQFPKRPQRRQKSSSSSSESTVPLAPQRMKKKLEKLNPTDMAPSVQDLMHDVFSKHIDDLQYVPVKDAAPLKFPHKFEEDCMLIENKVGKKSTERRPSKISIKREVTAEPQGNNKHNLKKMEENFNQTTVNSDVLKPIPLVNIDSQTKHQNADVLTETEALKALNNSLSSKQDKDTNIIIKNPTLNALSLSEIDHQLKQIIGSSPNVANKDAPAQTTKFDQMNMNSTRSNTPPIFEKLEIPFASSQIRVENDSQRSSHSNMKQQTLKEESRRSGEALANIALNAVDRPTDTEAPKTRNSSRRNSNQDVKVKNTPIITPVTLSPAQSMKFDQMSISSNRSGTPPMFKKLEIPSDTKPTPQISRRNSATSTLSEVASLLNLQPIYDAPMPKKLLIPIPVAQVDNNDNEPIAEVFKNRSWPKPDANKSERSNSLESNDMLDLTMNEKEINTDDNASAANVNSEELIFPNVESPFKSDLPKKVSDNVIVNESENDLQTSLSSTSKRRHSKDSSSSKGKGSFEWDMEMMPSSPIERRKFLHDLKTRTKLRQSNDSINSKNDPSSNSAAESEKLAVPTSITTLSKAQSKEKSLDWDMEKMPASPMPRRKFVHKERAPYKDSYIRDVSPTSSLKILNNIPQDNESAEEKERRLIEEIESERRQALNKREKEYSEKHKSLKLSNPKRRNSDQGVISMKEMPLMAPAHSSYAGSVISDIGTINSQRSGSPAMFKKLEIPADDMSTTQMSRTNSIATALSEYSSVGNFKPIYDAPLPKKLQVVKAASPPRYVPSVDDNEPIAEVFNNRPWPKPNVDEPERSSSVESVDIENLEGRITPRTPSPIPEVFKNRPWPKGNEKMSYNTENDRYHRYDPTKERTQSMSPIRPLRTKHSRRLSPHNSTQSLLIGATQRSSQSSAENDSNSVARSMDQLSNLGSTVYSKRQARITKPIETAAVVDTETRMLLDRGKRLHDRKRDFVNERVAERNPYMRQVFANEKTEQEIYDEAEEELEDYRPKNHSAPSRKFPTSRMVNRGNYNRHQYDYPSSTTPSYLDSGRHLYTSTIPRSSSSYLSRYPDHHTTTPSSSSSSYGRTHFADYFKRSPSLLKDRESCVQSDSESSSSDKVEQNSATEISTDSEFDHDEIIRETPKIFIDDTHLRKPTKVQVKSTVIAPTSGQKYFTAAPGTAASAAQTKGGSYLPKYQTPIQPQFKPLVQVDPSVLNTNRMPLQNPRLGDYQLNKTASTEGIASKKSLELKKRYLLGEPANGNKIQKSGSTSVLDSKIRSFHSNISECQKLLNPSSDISPTMKTFLDRTKLGDTTLQQSATTVNILNDLKVEITIQKASSAASTDNEKENIFVNSKNELNKGMEYSETVNTTLVETLSKKSPTTPTPNDQHPTVIETIDLVTPEKKAPAIIDLTQVEIPTKMLESNIEFINNIEIDNKHIADSNKIIDLTLESPEKNVSDDSKPDVSRGIKESIPDIIEGIETTTNTTGDVKHSAVCSPHSGDEQQHLLSNNSYDEEKKDSPEKHQHRVEIDESNDLQIQVPNIPWNIRKTKNCSSISGSSCTSSNTSSIEDIQHYILDSTTSPDTQTAAACIGQVPRLEVHDTAGELMQIDSLMIIDGKYIGDPEDLKLMNIPAGLIIPALPDVKTADVEDEPDIEPVTATPEPTDRTVIETVLEPPPLPEHGPPLPAQGPPKMKPAELKFDTRNENKVESLKNLPLIVDQLSEEQQHNKAIKPITLNLSMAQKSYKSTTTPTTVTPLSPLIDNDKTPTAELFSRGSDSETEATGTGTGQVLTETELSDWTADDCISENFIDIEFVLNSNKGTIKRNKNKKGKKKHASTASSKLSIAKESLAECSTNIAPVAEFEGILQNLDIDEIEFMDTGSEGSCAEAYSATNTAMLRNRGYMEFIETNTPKAMSTATTTKQISDTTATHLKSTSEKKPTEIITKRDEVLGIDYIEQGAYIMQRDDSQQDLLKTPVNEEPHASSVEKYKALPPINPLLSQSLTDSSTLNDDDSLGIVTPNSQTQLTMSNSEKTNTKTTTEESEALTVVTSPLDSSSPKLRELVGVNAVSVSNNTGSTPSSSDKNPKTSLSTCTPSSASNTSSSNATSPRRNSSQDGKMSTTTANPAQRNSTEELSYEDYVRVLQQKITQISSARGDSFDSRKQRRKSSKGEAPIMALPSDTQTVIDQATNQQRASALPPQTAPSKLEVGGVSSAIAEQRETTQAHKVPEIPTLSSRLEEITKERTKQKDLIHDLVMDKLQSKKQLNAEKRLHRSRQRTLLTSGFGITGTGSTICGYASGSSLSPTPKLAAASTTTDTNCTNQAHYHVSTASNTVQPVLVSSSSSFKENNPLQKSATYVAAYHRDAALSPTRSTAYKQRPFSEHLNAEQLEALEPYRLGKTPSFSYIMSTTNRNLNNQQKSMKSENATYSTPLTPYRSIRNHIASSPTSVCDNASVAAASSATDKLRSEARARARLKSNNELGLSPEEKMLLLRKRLNIDDQQQQKCHVGSPEKLETININARDRKMSTSKSVNDLSHFGSQLQRTSSAVNENPHATQKSVIIADFTSDPNLLLSSTSAQTAAKPLKEKSTSNRRQKDPERRKSIIQSLSSFFHMGNSGGSNNGSGSNKKDSTSNVDAISSAGHSAQSERPGTSGSSTTSGSVDGVFSRFRMSSKTKEKSKENGAPINAAASSSTATSTAKTGTKSHYERSSSQDCILNSKNSNIKHHSHSHHNSNNSNTKKSTTASAYSSSSPQLFVTKSSVHYAATDDQTPPPIPPLPLHYQRSDDESYATETREQKKQRSISKAIRQAELKRLRIAQEIQREQEEIEVQLKELEARGVLIEKALRGESQPVSETLESTTMGASDEKLLKELLDIWRNITQLKKRDEELSIRQQELQLEHRHAQLKEELNIRLSSNKLDKSSADVAAEGAILNEMLEIVAKRAALRPTASPTEMEANINHASTAVGGNLNTGMPTAAQGTRTDSIKLLTHGQSYENSESNI